MATKNEKTPKPRWLKVKAPASDTYFHLKKLLRKRNLHTVCEEARCPNIGECWQGGTATFMLMGDVCTRGCRFCAVKTSRKGTPIDPLEPLKIADAANAMGLEYVVLTSVDRDDLDDQGSKHFAETIRKIKQADDSILVEALIPDFRGDTDALANVVAAKPEVLAHNIETVKRLTPSVRDPRATYEQSLRILRATKDIDSTVYTKSSIMVGLGETFDEVKQSMLDLRANDVDVLTVGQYLQPTHKHLKVQTFIHPETFEQYKQLGLELGFLYVAAGPLVRSSYRAGEFFIKGIIEKKRKRETTGEQKQSIVEG